MKEEQDNFIAESKDDFIGWEILHIEDWKASVKRVHMRKTTIMESGKNKFMMVYADEELTKELVIGARA